MRRVYVVAHPESQHHLDDVVGGWYDSELTPKGHHDATLIASRLRELIPEGDSVAVHSSDLTRTMQTAAHIAPVLGVGPQAHRSLREKSYGVAEGRPQAWLDQRFIPPPSEGDRMGHHEGVDGSETKRAFAERIYAAMSSIESDPATHQVVVTHGFAVTFLVAAWIRMPLEATGYVNFRSTSGGLTLLGEDDFFHNRAVLSVNETTHLAA
jgi:probable phosphoglycerate mutase